MAKKSQVTSAGKAETTLPLSNSGTIAAAEFAAILADIESGAAEKSNVLELVGTKTANAFDKIADLGAKFSLTTAELCDGIIAAALGNKPVSAPKRSEYKVAMMAGAKGLWSRAKAAIDQVRAVDADAITSQNRKDKTLTAARRLLDNKSEAEVVTEFTVSKTTTLQDKSINKLCRTVEATKGDGPVVAALLAEFKATWRKIVALPDVSAVKAEPAPQTTTTAAPAEQPKPTMDFAQIWANIGQLPAAEQPRALAALMGMSKA